ncbi:MAG: PAS domain-containing protein, partial [Deltaproteobacteria bacterium]|nr:PAS domain-containing protein [Deltaproteobacteria bacterium]
IVDSIPQSVFWKDLESVYLGCNRQLARRAGLADPRAIIGKTDFDLPWSREEAEAYRADDREVMALRRPKLHIVETARQADGTTIWLDTSKVPLTNDAGDVYGVLGLFDDTTERRQAEARLLEYRRVIESSGDLICVFDASYRYALANEAYLSSLALALEDVVGRTIEEVRGVDVFLRLRPEIDACLSGQERSFALQLTHPQKGARYHSVRYTPIVEGERATGVASVMRDVSEEKRLEGQLLQAQKMEAVGHLAGGIAHDFNNILSVILGYCHLIQSGFSGDDKQRERLGLVTAAAERAAQLTRSLLAFSRKQMMSPKAANLVDIVQRVQKLLARIIGEDVRLKTVSNEARLPVFVDDGQIEQVLVNLATNARDAMPQGGLLTIETGTHEIDSAFVAAHGWGLAGRYAVLTVSDTGCGMDEETRNRIFEPFFTTKETGKGTGLGMSIAFGIVKQHRGFLSVYSEPGNGSVFKIFLPLTEEGRAGDESPAPPAAASGGNETILVAEDEAAVRNLIATVLSDAGYRVVLAVDGQNAVQQFAADPDWIDLALMDLIMPKKGGREASEEIRALRPQTRVLFVSGYSAEFIESRGGPGAGADLLTKPVRPLDLLRKVREILDR